jgi:undecaprenyl-diphosphatase
MNYFEAFILALVEGLTEFLPVSSTGHMIIASSIFGIAANPFVKTFTVVIQLGAILSVVWEYRAKFLHVKSIDFYKNLIIGFIPAAIIGFLLNDLIEQALESVMVVAINLIVGGIILLFVDKWFAQANKAESEFGPKKAVLVGLAQCIAMLPGVSRSAATILGSLAQGFNKKTAAEYSFFLAVPTMAAATAYALLKAFKKGHIHSDDFSILIFGNIVAFIVAWFAIRSFIGIVTKYGFVWFGWYRIIVGGIILAVLLSGAQMHII